MGAGLGFFVLCDPDDHDIDIVWKSAEGATSSITINEGGQSVVDVEIDGKKLAQEFAVST